jgi:hypothetical protein
MVTIKITCIDPKTDIQLIEKKLKRLIVNSMKMSQLFAPTIIINGTNTNNDFLEDILKEDFVNMSFIVDTE